MSVTSALIKTTDSQDIKDTPKKYPHELTSLFYSAFNLANAAFSQKKFGACLIQLNIASKIMKSPLLKKFESIICSCEKKTELALKDLDTYLQISPNDIFALETRVYLFALKNQVAILDIEKLIELHPDNLTYIRSRSIYFFEREAHSKALEDFNRYIQGCLKNHLDLKSFLHDNPQFADILEILLYRSSIFLKLNQYSDAKKDLIACDEIFSDGVLLSKLSANLQNLTKIEYSVLKHLGAVYSTESNFSSLIDCYKKALKLPIEDDKKAKILDYLSEAYLKNDDFENALDTYQKILTIDPSKIKLYIRCSIIHVKLEDNLKAEESLETFLNKLKPSLKKLYQDKNQLIKHVILNPDDYVLIDVYLVKALISFNDDPIEALKHFNEYCEILASLDQSKLNKDDLDTIIFFKPFLYQKMIDCYYRSMQYDKAANKINETLAIFSKDYTSVQIQALVALRINCYVKLEAFEKAIEDCNTLLKEASEEMSQIRYTRAISFYYLGKYQEAVMDFEQAFEIRSSYLMCIESLVRLNNFTKALAIIDQAIERYPYYLSVLSVKDVIEHKLNPNAKEHAHEEAVIIKCQEKLEQLRMKNDWQGVIDFSKDLWDLNPSHQEFFEFILIGYLETGQYDQIVEQVIEAIELKLPLIVIDRAVAQISTKKVLQAFLNFQSQNPNHAMVPIVISFIAFRLKENKLFLDNLELYLTLNGDAADAYAITLRRNQNLLTTTHKNKVKAKINALKAKRKK